ncbi:hypothetical protein Sru01_36430 [Sphaerisporangium rufum]|uniref:Uncharacterized protein n=1 Tax=Sphaerisporangium rufum TaxID=1381558 RepID=A0A919R5A4_9ACTN|nr:hypothetical protein Sru01_36430 [Sphaerisporangium rufum]
MISPRDMYQEVGCRTTSSATSPASTVIHQGGSGCTVVNRANRPLIVCRVHLLGERQEARPPDGPPGRGAGGGGARVHSLPRPAPSRARLGPGPVRECRERPGGPEKWEGELDYAKYRGDGLGMGDCAA